MREFFYVYILVSEADAAKHYTGITRDLFGRLQEHNRGHCRTRQNIDLEGLKQPSHSHRKPRRAHSKDI
jgi:predicted GIY-YIG superfamily endonuclease